MLITDYYQLKKGKGETRFDEVASTGCYAPLEVLRNTRGKLFTQIYGLESIANGTVTTWAPYISKDSITINLYGFVPAPNCSADGCNFIGYGNLVGTQDALLFAYDNWRNQMELFIIRGCKEHTNVLYSFLTQGRLLMETELIRKKGRAQ